MLAVPIAAVALLAAASGARAADTLVLPRAGQVGIGVQPEFGSVLSSGDLGEEFGSGPGIAVRLRYRMRFERAMGLSFEAHSLDAREPSGRAGAFDALTDNSLRDRLQLLTAGFEFYQMFDTRERTTKMLSAGVGLAQMSAHLTNGDTQYPIGGDGVYLSAGAGLERFVFRSLAWDLSTRYFAIFHDGTVNHDLQISLGMIFYAAY